MVTDISDTMTWISVNRAASSSESLKLIGPS